MAVAKKRLFVIFSVLTCVLLISLSVTAIFAWRKADFATTINFEYSYEEQEYIFEETASGALILTGLGPAYQGNELEVPSQNSQKAVVGISDNAFLNNQTITTVIIPKSVTSIGEYAFAGCENLTSVTVEDNAELTEISYAAFQSCSNLQTVDFGANSKLETIGAHAFCENSSLTEIVIPASVTNISELAFNGCDNLTSVTFSNSNGWFVANSSTATSGTNLTASDLTNVATTATYLKSTYVNKYWINSST